LLELVAAEMEASGRAECLPSTRQDVLSKIIDWATDPSCSQNVLWYHGLAGSGKSTLSTTVASIFRDLSRLGAFVFFDRAFPERSHPSKVIRTLAYKLGLFDRRIGTAICAAIDNFPSVIDASLRVQFIKLLVEPLASLAVLQAEGPIILVLDALDECGSPTEREALLTVLGTELSRLPSMIRILVTSRKLDDITATFEGQQNILTHSLEVSSEIGRQDILTYFEHQLGVVQRKRLRLRSDWPGDDVIQDLRTRSCGLFIWASTVAKFIDSFDPASRLAVILRGETTSGAQSALDALYKTALEDACAWDDVEFVQHFRNVLQIILVLQNPLATSTLDRLIGLPEGRESSLAISALGCVIADNPTVHLLHPSFADFLFSRTRCGRDMWHFNPATCHQHLALKCLDRLSNNGLKRNICNLRLSVALKGEKVPDDIAYACVFWINHTCFINEDAPLLVVYLETFLTKHLLHWFEVMSILGRSRETITLLDSFHVWMTVSLPCLLLDARVKYNHHHRKRFLAHTIFRSLCTMPAALLRLLQHSSRNTHC
jgi:NACHT domain